MKNEELEGNKPEILQAPDARRDFIELLYHHLLRRTAGERELEHWTSAATRDLSDHDVFRRFVQSEEYREKASVVAYHPPGHYYSPTVNPNQVKDRGWVKRDLNPLNISGIDLDVEMMRNWWRDNASVIAATSFPDEDDGEHRYFARNDIYPIGDASILRTMMLSENPKRIIEIGSGFSSACALDTIEEYELSTILVLIEPYAQRLRERLRARDDARVVVIEKPVQEVELDLFSKLEPGDIVFIDSTHVMKTGSDVNYELFSIMPTIPRGVRVHFHDMHFPFEYPDEWIFNKNYSWNEVYAVRAFLMYNEKFKVEFMNHMYFQLCQEEIVSVFPRFNDNPGGGLWIRKIRD